MQRLFATELLLQINLVVIGEERKWAETQRKISAIFLFPALNYMILIDTKYSHKESETQESVEKPPEHHTTLQHVCVILYCPHA